VYKSWRAYVADTSPPTVKDGRGRRSACGCASYLKLPKVARNGPTVLHEMSHAILDWWETRAGIEYPGHGPRFVKLLLLLWEEFLDLPQINALEHLKTVPKGQHAPKVAYKDDLPWVVTNFKPMTGVDIRRRW